MCLQTLNFYKVDLNSVFSLSIIVRTDNLVISVNEWSAGHSISLRAHPFFRFLDYTECGLDRTELCYKNDSSLLKVS